MTSKRLLTAAGIATLTLLLSACISLKAEITLSPEARATGTMSIAISKQLANFADITSPDDFKSQLDDDSSDLPEGASIDVSESETEYIATVSFEDTALEDDGFKAEVQANGDVSFTFVNEGTEPATEENPFGDINAGTVTVTVNFPGEVTDFSGEGATQVDSDTVMWEFPFETGTTATATSGVSTASVTAAAASATSSSSTMMIVLLGLAALVAVFVAVALLMRRGKNEPVVAAGPAPSEPASGDPGPQGPTA